MTKNEAIESAVRAGVAVRGMLAKVGEAPDLAGLWHQEMAGGDWAAELAVIGEDEARAAFERGVLGRA